MLGLLEKDRYSISETPDNAEVIIVNTCSFIQASKEESIETILEMAQLKQAGNCKVLVASGCLPQRYSKELEQEMPEVDLFIGTGQYHRITELLNAHGKAVRWALLFRSARTSTNPRSSTPKTIRACTPAQLTRVS